MLHRKYLGFAVVVGILSGLELSTSTAQAYPHNHFERGHWIHDRHEGRLGWWWVAGSSWRFFARPYAISPHRTVIIEEVPPPAPQVTVVQQAPPPAQMVQQPVLYYCKETRTYYPDTMTCPAGWAVAAAGAPPDYKP